MLDVGGSDYPALNNFASIGGRTYRIANAGAAGWTIRPPLATAVNNAALELENPVALVRVADDELPPLDYSDTGFTQNYRVRLREVASGFRGFVVPDVIPPEELTGIAAQSWAQYFDYYYLGEGESLAGIVQTNIAGAVAPVLQGGAAFADGVFTFAANGDYVELPAEASANLADAAVVILGVIGNQTGSDIHPIFFEALDERPLLTQITNGDYLNVYGNNVGAQRISNNGTVPNDVDVGVGVVLRVGSMTGYINGAEQLTSQEDWGFESDDVLHLGENKTQGIVNGNFIGTMKNAVIMSTNAAYDALDADDKAAAVSAAAVWASTNATDK